jgi:hypothetical protein
MDAAQSVQGNAMLAIMLFTRDKATFSVTVVKEENALA